VPSLVHPGGNATGVSRPGARGEAPPDPP
jgi:hypothetical protein